MKFDILFVLISLFLLSCETANNDPLQNDDPITLTDIDSNVYDVVKIGDQIWMAENLNVGKFRNGDIIPEARTNEEWRRAQENYQPAWCYFNNDPNNGLVYGKLYNWYAVSDPRGLAPEGWKIPSDEEWEVLSVFLGGNEIAGKKMKSTTGWPDNGNGTNECGFNALPANYRTSSDFEPREQSTLNRGKFAVWWTSVPSFQGHSWYIQLHSSQEDLSINTVPQGWGTSIRCIKN